MARRWRILSFAAALVAVVATATLVVGREADGGGDDPRAEAVAAAVEFLDTYVEPDGRVVRTDQGGDTVSEGQAYGMLVAAGIGDEDRFRLIWGWAAANLQRDDLLLAWRWADGAVADPSPASDADLVAAGALALAGARFDDVGLVAEASAMGAAILAGETATLGGRRVLLAGPWATTERVVNPSYFVVGLMSRLWWATGERGWEPVASSSRSLLDELTATAPSLVADWATVAADGTAPTARAAPGGGGIRSGFEAGRAYVQLAVDCDATGQAIAARAWPFFSAEARGTVNAAYLLDGRPASASTHPLALIAAAASAAAAGHDGESAELLDRADDLDEEHPTYYGSAWIAIARLWLDTEALGGCRPGHPTS